MTDHDAARIPAEAASTPNDPGACMGTPNSIAGAAITSPYLVLRTSAAPAIIRRLESSTVTADLTVDSSNVDRSAGGTVPNGVTAAFSGTLGTFAAPSSSTTGGKATDLYTAGAVTGTAVISTIVDGQTVSNTIVVAYNTFTDDPLIAAVTVIRTVHVIELRERIDGLRARFSLGGYPWTDGSLGAGTSLI